MNAITNKAVPGSLQAVAAATGKSLAETFLSATAIILVDTSGSMSSEDSRGGKSRYMVACEELEKLQANMPGKLAIISFSSEPIFNPGGIPQYFGGGTDLAKALTFAKVADLPKMRFVVISDGEPDDDDQALSAAKTFKARIDVIYVGPETYANGRDFLQRLAKASGGQITTADRASELAAVTSRLLLTA